MTVEDLGNLCVFCRRDTSWGSGRFVNRIPAETDDVSGYVCVDCQTSEDDACNTCGGSGEWLTTTEDSPTVLVSCGPCPDCQREDVSEHGLRFDGYRVTFGR